MMTVKLTNVNPQMEKISTDAVIIARAKFGVSLDYSENSLQQLEILLKQADEQYQQASSTEDPNYYPLDKTARAWGSYLGEVIRRNLGGDWIADQKAVFLQLGNRKLSPLGQIRSRIEEGPLFNVVDFYQGLKAEVPHPDKDQALLPVVAEETSPKTSLAEKLSNAHGWEYMFIQLDGNPIANGVYVVSPNGKREKLVKGYAREEKIVEILNFYGKSGWEVVGVGNRGTMMTWTVKRGKT
jgi:hypothetical protein